MKTCSKCGHSRPRDDFHREARSADGKRSHCKSCERNAAKRKKCNTCRKQIRIVDFPANYATCKSCLRKRNKKVCTKCKKLKARDGFHKSKQNKDGLHPYCKECQKPKWARYYRKDRKNVLKRKATWYLANRERYYRKRMATRFGITEAEYVLLLSRSSGLCEICRQPETRTRFGKIRRLSIDHDHATGDVRGLLCSKCNAGIGQLNDDPTILAAAIRYLSKTKHVKTVRR